MWKINNSILPQISLNVVEEKTNNHAPSRNEISLFFGDWVFKIMFIYSRNIFSQTREKHRITSVPLISFFILLYDELEFYDQSSQTSFRGIRVYSFWIFDYIFWSFLIYLPFFYTQWNKKSEFTPKLTINERK